MNHQTPYYYTRKLLSWIFFIVGAVALILFFIKGAEEWILLVGAIISFLMAYWVSPHQKSQSWDFSELLWDEYIIQLVFKVLTWPFRLVGKLLENITDVSP